MPSLIRSVSYRVVILNHLLIIWQFHDYIRNIPLTQFTLQTLLLIQAKDMITLVNQFAADIEEKKGTITEDEVW